LILRHTTAKEPQNIAEKPYFCCHPVNCIKAKIFMAQFGKASSKKGKPSYIYAIIGVALVLFLFGFVGWFLLNLKKTGDYFKENIQVQAFVNRDASKKVVDSAVRYLQSQAYIKSVAFIDKQTAIKRYEAENDSIWKTFINANPLPESIEFFVKASHVQKDSIDKISTTFQENYPGLVSEFQFPKEVVSKVGDFARNIIIGLLIAAALLTILVIFSIDNTIRLAMYSNRFLIKTMQMVGATRWFIAKPINIRAIMNGFISALVAIAMLAITIWLIEAFRPEIRQLRNKNLALLIAGIIVVGVLISLVSTHRAVIKYLKLKLDELY
jgi:cell division transport system permease protein